MNLGKLLGAGKSFISGGKPAAYRADKRVYLPQFVSPKNPFANHTATAAPVESSKQSVEIAPAAAKKVAPAWVKTQKLPAVVQGASSRKSTWVSKLNPASIFRAAPSSANEATPVQVELSLEKVKVVHNDLTDADVEVVPMKSRPAREVSAETQPASKSWTDLGERIMKATAL